MILPDSRIYLNTVPDRYERETLLRVLPYRSPFKLQDEVERMARYFRREMQYDFVQFERNDKDPSCTAYLFLSRLSAPPVWAGACCFRACEYEDAGPKMQTLDWVWMHPFFRGQGLLARAWPGLRANHGDFVVSHPISPAMRAFLLKHNRDSKYSVNYEA